MVPSERVCLVCVPCGLMVEHQVFFFLFGEMECTSFSYNVSILEH